MSKKSNELTFFLDGEEVITINKEGFYYKGELVDDAENVYKRFNDWLKVAEIKKNDK